MKSGRSIVAIVGRPNVGKSSLFNLMLKDRKSIVDETEGTTRDINMGEVELPRGGKFYLYDTAGYLEKGDRFNALVQEKVKQAISYADMLLFMVDGRDYHPIDEQLAAFLKKQQKPVIVLANKLDNRFMEKEAMEFYNLGFEQILPFSVAHKRGYATLMDEIEDRLELLGDESFSEDEIRIAIVGKPNVGKSQLLNSLVGYDRSIVSEVPGTTRDALDDVIEWEGKHIRLVDTAGLRRNAKIDSHIEYYSAVRTVQAIERSQVVIQLIDSADEISAQDKRIAETVLEKGRGLVFAYNKWDLIEKADEKENYRKMLDYRKKLYNELPANGYVPIEFISAKDNYKLERLMMTAMKVYENYRYRVTTSDLNTWATAELKETNLDKPRSNLKVYYITQAAASPPYFLLFINKMDHVRKDYARFVENRLRQAFEFTGVPIKIGYREKERDKEKKKH